MKHFLALKKRSNFVEMLRESHAKISARAFNARLPCNRNKYKISPGQAISFPCDFPSRKY